MQAKKTASLNEDSSANPSPAIWYAVPCTGDVLITSSPAVKFTPLLNDKVLRELVPDHDT